MTSLFPPLHGAIPHTNYGWSKKQIEKRMEEVSLITLNEKERLQTLLRYLEHQELADQYQEQLFHRNPNILPTMRRHSKIDVSNRLRDEQGRFLPSNYQTMEESELTFDKEQDMQRKLKVKPIADSYNSYVIEEKEKRDWSGNIYLGCVAAILAIAFFT